jgi:O-antigen/teichoic acid export membrane protein
VWLLPAYGLVGAAIAFMLSCATQTVVAFVLARRVYPMSYETGRIARLVAAGVLAAGAGLWAVPIVAPLTGVFLRALTVIAAYAALLWLSGFLRASERAFLREASRKLRKTVQ